MTRWGPGSLRLASHPRSRPRPPSSGRRHRCARRPVREESAAEAEACRRPGRIPRSASLPAGRRRRRGTDYRRAPRRRGCSGVDHGRDEAGVDVRSCNCEGQKVNPLQSPALIAGTCIFSELARPGAITWDTRSWIARGQSRACEKRDGVTGSNRRDACSAVGTVGARMRHANQRCWRYGAALDAWSWKLALRADHQSWRAGRRDDVAVVPGGRQEYRH